MILNRSSVVASYSLDYVTFIIRKELRSPVSIVDRGGSRFFMTTLGWGLIHGPLLGVHKSATAERIPILARPIVSNAFKASSITSESEGIIERFDWPIDATAYFIATTSVLT